MFECRSIREKMKQNVRVVVGKVQVRQESDAGWYKTTVSGLCNEQLINS